MAETQLKDDHAMRLREAEHPQSLVVRFGADQPLKLDAGVALAPFQIAYQTYGTLNGGRSKAGLFCPALTGDQHVAHVHSGTSKPGWGETLVGPGQPTQTERCFLNLT